MMADQMLVSCGRILSKILMVCALASMLYPRHPLSQRYAVFE